MAVIIVIIVRVYTVQFAVIFVWLLFFALSNPLKVHL